jgi:SAM-dependent methyltransferase
MDFDRFAHNYTEVLDGSTSFAGETSEYFVQYKAKHVRSVLGPGPWKILDFGCGVGTLSSALKALLPGSAIHGFDVSPASISQVDRELAASGIFTTETDELDSDYSLVVISNVLHHIDPPARPAVFRDLAARLAPGGRIFIFEHNPINPLTRWVVAHCPFDDGVQLLTPGEIAQYFRGAGLQLVRRDYVVFFPKLLAFLRPLEPALGWCPGGAQFAIVGQKNGASGTP